MNDLGCHTIEMARYFFGKDDKIVEVMAWGATPRPPRHGPRARTTPCS